MRSKRAVSIWHSGYSWQIIFGRPYQVSERETVSFSCSSRSQLPFIRLLRYSTVLAVYCHVLQASLWNLDTLRTNSSSQECRSHFDDELNRLYTIRLSCDASRISSVEKTYFPWYSYVCLTPTRPSYYYRMKLIDSLWKVIYNDRKMSRQSVQKTNFYLSLCRSRQS